MLANTSLCLLLLVLEEVIDAFLFHEPAGEIQIRLAVLHAVVPRLEGALQLVFDVEAFQHLLQNVGYRLLLEDTALRLPRQQPELGHDFHGVGGEMFVLLPLADAVADAVEVAFFAAGERQLDADLLPHELVEIDLADLVIRGQ